MSKRKFEEYEQKAKVALRIEMLDPEISKLYDEFMTAVGKSMPSFLVLTASNKVVMDVTWFCTMYLPAQFKSMQDFIDRVWALENMYAQSSGTEVPSVRRELPRLINFVAPKSYPYEPSVESLEKMAFSERVCERNKFLLEESLKLALREVVQTATQEFKHEFGIRFELPARDKVGKIHTFIESKLVKWANKVNEFVVEVNSLIITYQNRRVLNGLPSTASMLTSSMPSSSSSSSSSPSTSSPSTSSPLASVSSLSSASPLSPSVITVRILQAIQPSLTKTIEVKKEH
jgi:hypothetical protein